MATVDPSLAIPNTNTFAVPFPCETRSGAAIAPFTGLLTPSGGVVLTIDESIAVFGTKRTQTFL